MNVLRTLGLATLLSAVMPLGALAETAAPQTATPAAAEYRSDYLIAPGDTLQVFVWKNPELTADVPVRPDGKITTPLVQDIQAQGKTPSQLAADLRAALSSYIRDPTVTVVVPGRSAVGLVFTALNRYHVRDRSVFHFFEPTHRYVNALVEPVALNRFSLHGPGKTASGLLAALLVCEIARDTQAPKVSGTPLDFGKAARAEAWLSSAGAPGEQKLRQAVHDSFGLNSSVLDPVIAASFRQRVDHELDSLIPSLSGTDPQLQRRLRPRPPTSFRDIDTPAEFSANGPIAGRMFDMLGGEEADDDLPDMADEQQNT